MSGGGGSSTTVEKADPWEGVQPFLRQGYSDSSDLYTGTAPQYYPGNTVAGFNDIQNAGFGSAINFAATGAPDIYNMGLQGVQSLLGAGSGFGGSGGGGGGGGPSMAYLQGSVDPNAQRTVQDLMAARDPSLNPGFATAQQLAGMNDPTKLLGYQQMQGLQAASDPSQNRAAGAQAGLMGMADPTQLGGYGAIQQLMNAGNAGNNPFFQDTLQASLRPVTQAFQEEILPGIRSNAGAMGQVGSSRQGIAEGLAGARANQQMADIAAQMGNQAYGQGLQAMASAGGLGVDYGRLGQSALAQAGQLGTQITGQQLQGLGQAGQLGQQLQGQALGNMQAGGGMLSGMYGQGLQAAQGAAGTEYGKTQGENQIRADLARSSAQLQASQNSAAAQARSQNMQAQIQALGMLPMLSGLGLQQSNILGQVGGAYQGQGQQQIDADQARWNYEQQQPYNMLNDYMSMLAGAPGGSRSTSQPMTRGNPMMGALGGAASGAAIGSAVPVIGTGIGAAAGGILGLMGYM